MSVSLEYFAPGVTLLALFYGWVLWSQVRRQGIGTPAMEKVAAAIREGAHAFLKRQYRTILGLSLAVAAAIVVAYGLLGGGGGWVVGGQVGGAFAIGAVLSAIAGVASMVVAVRANVRTAHAAASGLNAALTTALRAGAVSGILIVALSVLGVAALYLFYRFLGVDPSRIPALVVGYGFGASFVALFAQLGGGIYTKAADVGADLVGKLEAGIPEDDPRNPAVIADLVGDNVGDCAGRGADLFESISAESIGAMVLSAALFPIFGVKGVLFPLVLHALGLVATILGLQIVRARDGEPPMRALTRGFWLTTALAVVALFFTTKLLLSAQGVDTRWLFGAGLVGILTAIAFVYITDYYTGKRYRPVQAIAKSSQTGHGTNIITGMAVGMESTALPVIAVSLALLLSFAFGTRALAGAEVSTALAGLYGTAVATMGMLATVGYILAMDMYGPITDNAGGIVEMSNAPESARRVTDELDATGNTTKAITKGYAIGSAALAAFLLFSAYLEESDIDVVDLAQVPVFVGALLGAMVVFLFASLAIRAVGRAASIIVEEVRQQFRSRPGILSGTEQPDYARAVDIATKGALRNMVLPGLLAVAAPIVVGLLLRAEAVAGFLMVGTIAGVLLAAVLNNSGAAWDNAKKFIEAGNYGGKKSPAHQAAVTGDMVGDPFKDTAGPSLHVLIKLFSTLTLALAALFV
ncbi:MAG: K(+)-stimulated pyrophosphate-energized sodium pump [Parcubacteria group bacterium Gr01-1014_38]|nr:MAG: K(+)-stimulated pyrophosphate-energized sodium pump [Parcubacteria group bacterium Gr01-1014_38]